MTVLYMGADNFIDEPMDTLDWAYCGFHLDIKKKKLYLYVNIFYFKIYMKSDAF